MTPKAIVQAIRAGSFVIAGILVPVVLGLIFNWGFVLYLVVHALFHGFPKPLIGWIGCITVFTVAFPLVYFWLARAAALRKGLMFALAHAEGLIAHVADLAVGQLIGLENPRELSFMALSQLSDGIQKAYEKMPFGLRRLIAFLVGLLPFASWYGEIRTRLSFTEENRPQLNAEFKERIEDYVREELAGSGFPWIWAVAALNLAMMVFCCFRMLGG
jgi:hypothetical protein